MTQLPQKPWAASEDWALLDNADDYTAGDGANAATFWTALSTVPELRERSATECEVRVSELRSSSQQAVPATGAQPMVLEDWERQADGRYTGRVEGESSFLWVTVVREGRLASDPSAGPGWVEGVDGRIYELSRANAAAAAAAAAAAGAGATTSLTPSAAAAPVATSAASTAALGLSLPQQVASLAASVLLSGGIGFGVAGGFSPPPPPPPPPAPIQRITKVIVSPGATVSKSLAAKAGTPAPSAAPKRETAALTLAEQRQRAEVRLEKDRAAAVAIEAKIKGDEGRVAELKRLEAERGGEAGAVNLRAAPVPGIFPE